jgi:hypothetical protein
MLIKLEMSKSNDSAHFEQYFENIEDLTKKLAQNAILFDFYSILIDNKTIVNKKPIKGAINAFSNTFSN